MNNLLNLLNAIEKEPYHMSDLSDNEIAFIKELVKMYDTNKSGADFYAKEYKELINKKINGDSYFTAEESEVKNNQLNHFPHDD